MHYITHSGIYASGYISNVSDINLVRYSDLVASVDVIITKPGYGMFMEAGLANVPLIIIERSNWPDCHSLVEWAKNTVPSTIITEDDFMKGRFNIPIMTVMSDKADYISHYTDGTRDMLNSLESKYSHIF